MSRRNAKRTNYGALEKLEDGEEFFPLIGRDRATPITIKLWAHLWLQEIDLGVRSESDRAQVTEALRMATRIEIWARDRRQRQEHAALEFDDRGVPMTGPHARKSNQTTSGANEV